MLNFSLLVGDEVRFPKCMSMRNLAQILYGKVFFYFLNFDLTPYIGIHLIY